MRQDILIRHAVQSDLSEVKRLADENRESLGFVMRSALAFGIECKFGNYLGGIWIILLVMSCAKNPRFMRQS